MHERLERLIGYLRIGGLPAVIRLSRSMVSGDHQLASARSPDARYPFHIRVRTSDYACYQQVFVQQQYAFDARWQPRTVIDAGANIGLASIFFASAYPGARVIAVEPETGNFGLLRKNCAPYPRIECVLAALWGEDVELNVCDVGNGEWGYVTRAHGHPKSSGRVHHRVRGITMARLLDESGIEDVDILKVDIEGSEKEVLAGHPEWLQRIGVLVIETHDWLRPGCEKAVTEATAGFEYRWQQGENLVLAREGACIAPPRNHAHSSVYH